MKNQYKMQFTPTSISLESILKDFEKNIIQINTEYQRGYVWKDDDMKGELVRSVFKNFPIGSILRKGHEPDRNKPFGWFEIIDGQQRIKTLLDFKNGNWGIPTDIVSEIYHDNLNLFQIHENSDKNANLIIKQFISKKFKKLFYKDLPEFLARRFDAYQVYSIDVVADEKQIRDYFRVVQNQEKLRAGEIINSLPDTIILNYVSVESISNISSILRFNDDRKELFKNLNMVIALNADKIRMGATDKDILKAAQEMNNDWIDARAKSFFELFKQQSNMETKNNYKKLFSKGAIKLFLLTLLLDEEFHQFDIYEKRIIIEKTTEYVGYFNSRNVNKKNTINPMIATNVHNVWQLLKTTHSKQQVFKIVRTDLLAIFNFIKGDKNEE